MKEDKLEKALKRLKEMDKEIMLLAHSASLLNWDQETYMPSRALAERAEQIALLQGIIHEKITDPKHKELFLSLGADEGNPAGAGGLPETTRAFIREIFRRYTRSSKLPQALVMEMAKTTSIAQGVWAKARQENDFKLFQPHLEKIISLLREVAECLGYRESAYDPLLDEYEPWMTSKEVAEVFERLKEPLAQLVRKVVASGKKIDTKFLIRPFPLPAQREFNLFILKAMGFNLERGRIDISAHPFTTTLGMDDVRLTTRYNENFFPTSLFGTIHECGHGLYELGLGQEIRGSILANAASLGIHESQSRFWENMVGRSRVFWKGFFPKLKEYFSQSLDQVQEEQFYQAINSVAPSFIRVEADEVTYNLHIILRFQLEQRLISGELQAKDVPEVWAKESKNLLGIEPGSHTQGELQDIHWSMGAFGYFPTYTLGTLYACQFYAAMVREQKGIEEEIAKADLKPVLSWLKDHIHVHGAIYPAQVLCQRVTGEKLNPQFFIEYLEKKYGAIYDF
jgi:carboxypeptidase Taq